MISGIACDEYKLQTYKDSLERAGFTSYGVFHMDKKEKIWLIKVDHPVDRFSDLKDLIYRLELGFKAKNSKN